MRKMIDKILLAISIVVLLVPVNVLQAQLGPGPFSYQPPQGVNRWSDPSADEYVYKVVDMNQLSAPDATDNGLIVNFDMKLSLDEELKPLVAFSGEGPNGNNVIEIVYSKRTVTLTRYTTVNDRRVSYNYHLFDPLFEETGSGVSARWHFTVFFTSSSLYLVCTTIGEETRNMMSPIFFGLDDFYRYPYAIPGRAIMSRFMNRESRAVIKLGDTQWRFPAYISNIRVNSFNSVEWSKVMQREFATPQ